MSVVTWLIILIAFIVLEVATTALVSVWFIGGALVALILSALGAKLWLQLVAFFVVSGILLAILRPLAKKYFRPKEKFGTDRLIGKDAIVTEQIDNINGKGAIRIEGKEWSARSEDGAVIRENEIVEIMSLEGVKLIVKGKAAKPENEN